MPRRRVYDSVKDRVEAFRKRKARESLLIQIRITRQAHESLERYKSRWGISGGELVDGLLKLMAEAESAALRGKGDSDSVLIGKSSGGDRQALLALLWRKEFK